ncbi:MAG: FAD binding domain-containing protein [Rhizobiaceae bacterium]
MIPGSFEYHRPDSVGAAIKLLAEHGDEARVMAGGHSLIPLMKLRMTDIDHLIDLQAIDNLSGISIKGGKVHIGAMTTQHELINDDALLKAAPIIREASLQIADPQVRYMGTVGGNVANGDPGNDMPGLMQCLDATYEVEGPKGKREIKARDFYEAAYFTSLAEDEILTSVHFDAPAGGYAYKKMKRKIGDYATAAAAVLIDMDGGKCKSASIAMTNLSDTPIYSENAGKALVGTSIDDAAIDAAVAAMDKAINPAEDNRGPVDFKRHVAGVMLRRAIASAAERA